MKFALLGGGPEVEELLSTLLENGQHQLVAVFDAEDRQAREDRLGSEDRQAMLHVSPSSVRADSWESLLGGTLADAVLVGDARDQDRRADQLRKFAQASLPMILVHPACEAIVGFELDMICQDTKCPMIPYVPGLNEPWLFQLSEAIRSNSLSIGRIQQAVIERNNVTVAKHHLLRLFARDVLTARLLLGRITHLSAIGPLAESEEFGNLSVQMTTENGAVVRWSNQPIDSPSSIRIRLIGEHGGGELLQDSDSSTWKFQIPGWDSPEPTSRNTDAERLLQAFDDPQSTVDWDEACRATELAETVVRSLRRGRTIELHHEPHTEKDTFKGLMAAGGCFALLGTLGVFVLLGILEALDLPFMNFSLWQHWHLVLLAALGIFLSLQFLQLLFMPSSD